MRIYITHVRNAIAPRITVFRIDAEGHVTFDLGTVILMAMDIGREIALDAQPRASGTVRGLALLGAYLKTHGDIDEMVAFLLPLQDAHLAAHYRDEEPPMTHALTDAENAQAWLNAEIPTDDDPTPEDVAARFQQLKRRLTEELN